MSISVDAFNHLIPTEEQARVMDDLRMAAKAYAERLDRYLPEGPDKTYTLRKLREVAMWANVALTRLPDGTPIVRTGRMG
jgi:hypothetical protein